MYAVGTRVIAVSHGDGESKTLFIFGEGEYLGDLTPPIGTPTPFGPVDEELGASFTNPCIRLDDGGLVWGCQCWWGPVEQVRERYAGYTFVAAAPIANPPLPAGVA